ncbi:hypothetical protein FXF51_06320 [Nonomuraea sp. PA05]|uniref:hypothetical protein n=1 Tax=Nonomuraea sp. PA05 TaxID=2604466 RepID=UPI0011D6238A|nr:hypothetical protein [Nonomuraea sp. PA05]TYB69776.1 hypothetical protein FXF51_06320 [Nonomuraea sp. PA05]
MTDTAPSDFAARATELFESASKELNRYRPSDMREEHALRDVELAKTLALIAIATTLQQIHSDVHNAVKTLACPRRRRLWRRTAR